MVTLNHNNPRKFNQCTVNLIPFSYLLHYNYISLANVAEVVDGVAVVVFPAAFCHVEIDAGVVRVVLGRLSRCPVEFGDDHIRWVGGHPRPLARASTSESVRPVPKAIKAFEKDKIHQHTLAAALKTPYPALATHSARSGTRRALQMSPETCSWRRTRFCIQAKWANLVHMQKTTE